MEKKKAISAPKKGMNRDSHISELQNIEYALGVNIDTSNENGDGFIVQNEPSNYLGVLFNEDYKVVGFRREGSKTYFFLASITEDQDSEHYKRSSFGYIDNNILYTINEDDECCTKNILDTPLEQQTQLPTQTYVELIHDRCILIEDIEEKGLNFSINFPIKKIEVKEEKLGTIFYWNDFKNPFRYLKVTEVENNPINYLNILPLPCKEPTVLNCIDVDRLLVFPNHKRIKIEAESVQSGGNLRKGTYEFWATYCDEFGNEITNYSTPTNPVNIFDENNYILEQTELDAFTNYAIKLRVKNLDVENFKFYKVVAVERVNVQNTQSAFLVGIFNTTNDTVIYASTNTINDNNIRVQNISLNSRVDLNTLSLTKPALKRAKGTMSSDGRLWAFGLEMEEELNMQPAVNIFSSLLHWQTSVAKENLYKFPIPTSNYVGYMRNEVQPFAIRFELANGSVTPVYPFIGRPMIEGEDDIVEDKNFDSLEEASNSCIVNGRTKKWEIFNTAEAYDGVDCSSFEENGVTLTETIKKSCIIEEVFLIPSGETEFEIGDEFYNLKDYVNENPDEAISGITEYIEDEYAQTCPPSFIQSCTPHELISAENYIEEVLNEQITLIGKDIEEYSVTPSPTNCLRYREEFIDTTYQRVVDFNIFNSFSSDCIGIVPSGTAITVDSPRLVYFRNSDFTNESCNSADFLPTISDLAQVTNAIFLNYDASLTLTDLYDNNNNFDVEPTTIVAGFYENLHNKAQFFRINKTANKIILEITKQSPFSNNYQHVFYDEDGENNYKKLSKNNSRDLFDVINNKEIRYTIYDSCSSKNVLGGGIVNLDNGILVEIDATTFPDNFFVAIDTKIVSRSRDTSCTPGGTVYYVAPPNGCFSVHTRIVENVRAKVSWDSIVLNKKMQYQSVCTFTLPKIGDCDVIPYKKGRMAYWESIEEYPDNKQLYDSSNLKLSIETLKRIPQQDKTELVDYYLDASEIATNSITFKNNKYYFILANVGDDFSTITNQTDDVFLYTEVDTLLTWDNGSKVYELNTTNDTFHLKDSTDFTCQKIRHPKLPDNTVAPYLIDIENLVVDAESLIFPLGVSLDNQVVESIIETAYENGLITKKQKESIVGWELLKGDNTVSKSVIANGLAYDMYKYTDEDDQEVHYANFPYNDLGVNKFSLERSTNKPIKHPFEGEKNNLFSFISPDVFLYNVAIPSEASVQGYIFGKSLTGFADVEKHPNWTVLGNRAYRTANILAVAEVALELAIKTTEFITQGGTGNLWVVVGAGSTGSNAPGAGVSSGAIIAFTGLSLAQSFVKYGEYRYNWLKIFRDLGRMDNFASMQYSSGKYNRFVKNEQYGEDYLRALTLRKYLNNGMFRITDEANAKTYNVNNSLREDSLLLSTGNQEINYPTSYIEYDNNLLGNDSSTFTSSEANCDLKSNIERNIASPYVSLKNWIPDQWGTLDSIKWLTTNYSFATGEDTSCKPIYGGTVYISRFSWRRKVPLFIRHAINLADKLPYLYSRSSNIGKTRFFCDYETADDAINVNLGVPFPDIQSSYNFDCTTGNTSFYLRPPSKFYLYVHSVADFLVESEINCNFRCGKTQPKDQFYKNQSLPDWLQEVNLPIVEPNTFYYNTAYSLKVSNSPYKFLDRTYDKDIWKKRATMLNGWMWSEKDASENSLIDPWLVFKPLNRYEEKTDRGELIDIRSIESGQFLGRFTGQMQLYNPTNQVADAINAQNKELGTGFLSHRPLTFKRADLGFAGTQNTDLVSTPYGHFFVDAQRGRIFQLDQNGDKFEIISEVINGQPSNMKHWFREHLPYKILKYLPDLDIDNKFKGIGMNIWYDDRKARVFFTKRDYVLKSGVDKSKFEFNKETNTLTFDGEVVYFDNEELFKDVSWTISYKPMEGTWNSYFTFYPDYSPFYQEYFSVGYNWGKHKQTLWNHTLNNASFGVFQGELHGFEVEVPITNENVNKILESLSFNIEAKRYQNKWDFSTNPEIGITEMYVYNNKNNSGLLELIPQKTLADERKFPQTLGNIQKILTTFEGGKQSVNYFFNRLVSDENNIPMFKRDENNIFKSIDNRAVKFSGKRMLDRLKGESFIMNLSNKKDSRYNILLKNIINSQIIEP